VIDQELEVGGGNAKLTPRLQHPENFREPSRAGIFQVLEQVLGEDVIISALRKGQGPRGVQEDDISLGVKVRVQPACESVDAAA